jgi:hypothetical protein
MERLRNLVEGEGLKFFLDPNRDALMLGATGLNGRYQFLILLEVNGEFVQFRTLGYHSCPADHPNLVAFLKVMGELNYRLRFIKFGWDPADGEVVAYGDAWIADGDLSQGQVGRMCKSFMSLMDLQYARINTTIQTGEDPGEVDPIQAMGQVDDSGLPPEIRRILDQIRRRGAPPGDSDSEGDEPIIENL